MIAQRLSAQIFLEKQRTAAREQAASEKAHKATERELQVAEKALSEPETGALSSVSKVASALIAQAVETVAEVHSASTR